MFPYNLQNYIPNPYHPRQSLPVNNDIPEKIINALIDAGASHLSKDGKTAYRLRFGLLEYATDNFESWWVTDMTEIPEETVKL